MNDRLNQRLLAPAGREPRAQATSVVVRQLKRHLVEYVWVIALREPLRIPSVPVEMRRGSVILAGLLTSPLVICAFIWWMLTGRRLRGRLGAWLLDPAVVRVNVFRKPPAILLADSVTSPARRE